MKTFLILGSIMVIGYINYLLNIDEALTKMKKDSVFILVENFRLGRIERSFDSQHVVFDYNNEKIHISYPHNRKLGGLSRSNDKVFIEVVRLKYKSKNYYCLGEISNTPKKEAPVDEDLYSRCFHSSFDVNPAERIFKKEFKSL